MSVLSPAHYRKGQVECIEYTKRMRCCSSNTFKYLYCCGSKADNPRVQELAKALQYLYWQEGMIVAAQTKPFAHAKDWIVAKLTKRESKFADLPKVSESNSPKLVIMNHILCGAESCSLRESLVHICTAVSLLEELIATTEQLES